MLRLKLENKMARMVVYYQRMYTGKQKRTARPYKKSEILTTVIIKKLYNIHESLKSDFYQLRKTINTISVMKTKNREREKVIIILW